MCQIHCILSYRILSNLYEEDVWVTRQGPVFSLGQFTLDPQAPQSLVAPLPSPGPAPEGPGPQQPQQLTGPGDRSPPAGASSLLGPGATRVQGHLHRQALTTGRYLQGRSRTGCLAFPGAVQGRNIDHVTQLQALNVTFNPGFLQGRG